MFVSPCYIRSLFPMHLMCAFVAIVVTNKVNLLFNATDYTKTRDFKIEKFNIFPGKGILRPLTQQGRDTPTCLPPPRRPRGASILRLLCLRRTLPSL